MTTFFLCKLIQSLQNRDPNARDFMDRFVMAMVIRSIGSFLKKPEFIIHADKAYKDDALTRRYFSILKNAKK